MAVPSCRPPGLPADCRRSAPRLVVDDPFADPVRGRIDAPALELVTKLDPRTTVPARIGGRLKAGSGRLPTWLRPDWFDDLRVEPVMAHPHFKYPMYEPLHRYDREWMVPGLGLIKKPDMATLLETNNRFIEAYLVGLNHEMGARAAVARVPHRPARDVLRLVLDRRPSSSPTCTSRRGAPASSASTSTGARRAARVPGPRRSDPPLPGRGRARRARGGPASAASRSSRRPRRSRRCFTSTCRRTCCWSASR